MRVTGNFRGMILSEAFRDWRQQGEMMSNEATSTETTTSAPDAKPKPKKTFARVKTTPEQEEQVAALCEGSPILTRQTVLESAMTLGLRHIGTNKKVLAELL